MLLNNYHDEDASEQPRLGISPGGDLGSRSVRHPPLRAFKTHHAKTRYLQI